MATSTSKPLTWEHFDAPPIWGHGCNGDTIYKPDYSHELDTKQVSARTAPVESAAAMVATAAANAEPPVEQELESKGLEIRLKPIGTKPSEPLAAVAPPETVYEGPESTTVFDESKFATKKPDISVARNAVTSKIRRQAMWFLITAALLGFEYFGYKGSNEMISGTAGVTALVYLVLAGFAYKMNRMAFLIAIAFYGFSTLTLLGYALTSDLGILFVAKPLVVRCMLIYKHYRNYGMLSDLQELEQL
jgi:hypothetical protein